MDAHDTPESQQHQEMSQTDEIAGIGTNLQESALRLPKELWEKVFAHLPLEDIKSVRLTSRELTDTTSRFLFQPFVFRPDRKDFERFDAVMRDPKLAGAIKSLRFEIGEFRESSPGLIQKAEKTPK
jgi:hypothetical protein